MFHQSIAAWQSDDFALVVCQESQKSGLISLVQLMERGNTPLLDSMQLSLLSAALDGDHIKVKLGVFFQSVIAGCQCADDPNPIDSMPEYAEVEILIDPHDGSGCIL